MLYLAVNTLYQSLITKIRSSYMITLTIYLFEGRALGRGEEEREGRKEGEREKKRTREGSRERKRERFRKTLILPASSLLHAQGQVCENQELATQPRPPTQVEKPSYLSHHCAFQHL